MDRAVPFAHTGVGRGLLALLRCALLEGSADDLLAYLRTPGLLREPGLADRLEADVRRRGERTADGARALWEDTPRALAAGRHRPASHRTRHRGAAGAPGLPPGAPVQRAPPASGAAHGGRRAGRPARLPGRPRRADRAARGGPGRPAGRAGRRATCTRRWPSWRCGWARNPSPTGSRSRRRWTCAHAGSTRSSCAASRRRSSRRAGRPDAFLPDTDRRELARASGLMLPLREDRLERERYLFYVCASRAERRLVLSTRTSDEEGNPVRAVVLRGRRARGVRRSWPSAGAAWPTSRGRWTRRRPRTSGSAPWPGPGRAAVTRRSARWRCRRRWSRWRRRTRCRRTRWRSSRAARSAGWWTWCWSRRSWSPTPRRWCAAPMRTRCWRPPSASCASRRASGA